MSNADAAGYLPGDPRYGLAGEALKDYYRQKPAAGDAGPAARGAAGAEGIYRTHLHAHESYFASYGDSFIFRGPIRSADGADNIGTALLLELPDRAAAETFWTNEPFARNGGYQRDARIVRWVFGDEWMRSPD